MVTNKLQEKFDKLADRLIELEIKFIEPHSDPLEPPDDYNLDVQSYCVMSHAAFEQLFEDTCIYLLDKIQKAFNQRRRKISIGTLCLLHFDCASASLENQWEDNDRLADYLSKSLEKQKSILSNYAMTQNHGVDLKYLKKLLLPVGIDIPHDPMYVGSLEKLKDVRGTYAHSFNRARKPISPDDARNIVHDVYNMANQIKDKAINMRFS